MKMPSNIVAYEWPLGGTKQVAFTSGDDHIHEMVSGQERVWSDADVSELASAPALALEMAIMTGFAWPDGRTRQIAYVSPVDGNGHVHELVMREGNTWSYADLMDQLPGAPAADGLAIAGYAWKAHGTKQVVYTGSDSHLHELMVGVIGMWSYTDLMQLTGAPLAEGSTLAGYAWEAGGTKQVIYGSGDGHIHELVVGVGGNWGHTDLMQLTGAPLAEGSALAGYAWEAGGTKQAIYIGSDRHIYELVADRSGTWTYADLMQLTGAPLAAGSALAGYAWETGGTKQVVYVGLNRHVYELTYSAGGTWSHTDLTQLTSAPEASNELVLGYEWTAQYAKQVVYMDTRENPHIHELMLKHGSSWQHTDLTKLTGAPELV